MAERAARKQASAPQRAASKKSPTRQAAPKKAAPKKAAAKKAPAKKTAAKKAPAAKADTRKALGVEVPTLLDGRIPLVDPWPVVESGRMPAKAVVGEQVLTRVTAFREGHGSLGVEVVLRNPAGREHSRQRMRG